MGEGQITLLPKATRLLAFTVPPELKIAPPEPPPLTPVPKGGQSWQMEVQYSGRPIAVFPVRTALNICNEPPSLKMAPPFAIPGPLPPPVAEFPKNVELLTV